MREVLGIILGIVVVKITFAETRRNTRGLERFSRAVRASAIADGCALGGIEFSAGAETNLANNVLLPVAVRAGNVMKANGKW